MAAFGFIAKWIYFGATPHVVFIATIIELTAIKPHLQNAGFKLPEIVLGLIFAFQWFTTRFQEFSSLDYSEQILGFQDF